ncbi:MAG: glutamate 5-kinase [Syntrophales bacterium]|jgi:glutamate 5-kinase|nr:glutamate 5-kinase [Syntrophales bacterium]MCK9527105.1 glutamate 5-kinase [Syntrophales bacterium]MDX9921770.1 glutamate 5-kinase [Syntrophales bacterium]
MIEERLEIVKKTRRVLVKVGSGVLTKSGGIDGKIIANLAQEIARLSDEGLQFVIVSSGAIASGRSRLGARAPLKNLPQKQAAAAVGQGLLMEVYSKAFGKHGLIVAQMLLTMSDLVDRKRYLNTRNTLSALMEWKVIPIINENDTVSVDEIKFGDNDTLASMMANIMEANLLINLTNTEGLYDRNPRSAPGKARFIPLVREITDEIESFTSSETDTVGTGGMKSKLMAARKVTSFGIPCIIAPGKRKGVLQEIFEGKETGTLFLPRQTHMTSKKYWIAFTLRSRGKLVIDDGAVGAIVNNGKSLLPTGIIEVDGDFSIGDPVTCIDTKGTVIAKGLANYSSADLGKIKGLKTSRIEQVLGTKPYDEVIHRDNMAVSMPAKKTV